MKMFLKSFFTLALLVGGTAVMNAQSITKVNTADVKTENCEVKKCTPAMCDAMVAAGICTKEQAEACKAKCGTTKVASAKMEKSTNNAVPVAVQSAKASKSSSCAKTCAKSKKTAAKKTTP